MGRIHFGPPHFFYKNVIKLQSMAVGPEKVSGIQNPLDKDFFLPESYAFTMVSFQEEWETCSSQSKAELKLNCWLIDWLRERGHILQWEILKLGRIFRPWSCCQGRLTDLLNLFKESGWSLWEDLSPGLHKGQESFQVVLLPLALYIILFLFCFLVFECDTNVYHLGRGGEGCREQWAGSPGGDSRPWSETSSLGLCQPLPEHPLLWSSEWGEKGFGIPTPGTSAHCLHIMSALFLSSRTTGVWKRHHLCRLFFPVLFKVAWGTSQGTGFDKLSPWTLINLKISALGVSGEHFSSGTSRGCWALGKCFLNINVHIDHPRILLKYRFLFDRWGLRF